MAKQVKITEQMVSGTPSIQSPQVINLAGKVVAVSITNMQNSANELLIGWSENPSTKNWLAQGESRPYGPYAENEFITGQQIKFAFVNINGGSLNPGNNQALVIISTLTENEAC